MTDTNDIHSASDDSSGDVDSAEETYIITPEEQAAIDAIKRRNMRFAIIFGIILLILGFFAGRYAKHTREDSLPDFSTSMLVCELSGQGTVCL